MHGYLKSVLDNHEVEYQKDAGVTDLYKVIRKELSQIRDLGDQSEELNKMLRSLAAVLDALNPIRNRGSVAYPNDALIGDDEAKFVINIVSTVLHYLDAKIYGKCNKSPHSDALKYAGALWRYMDRSLRDVQMKLRDILYFDFEKAASLLSQLEGGLTRERSQSSEEGADSRNVRRYELFNTFKAEFGGISEEKKAVMETKVLHHDLLIRVEEALFEMGLACDATQAVVDNTPENERDVHAALAGRPYLQAEGWCAFEDFRKVYEATQNFNDLLRFIKRSELTTKYGVDELANSVDAILSTEGKNSKRYKDARDQHKAAEKAILEEIEKSKVPEWLLSGVREWIDTYIKDRLNMRVCPFEAFPNVEVIANLKRACFVDDDLTHLMYSYGSEPNVRLSVFGLVTSIPPKEGEEQFRMYPDDEQEGELEPDSDDDPLAG